MLKDTTKAFIDFHITPVIRDVQAISKNNQWDIWTQRECFCLHLNTYRYKVILLANQLGFLTELAGSKFVIQ